MAPSSEINPKGWMQIRSFATNGVISVGSQVVEKKEDPLRSQVYIRPPQNTEYEFWRWEDQFLRNKATGLVLDIRKGKLRLIEDTEICLYPSKPLQQAHNQLWATRISSDSPAEGELIYSASNSEWVLDVKQTDAEEAKLVLSQYMPFDNEGQFWDFVPVSEAALAQSAAIRARAQSASTSLCELSPSCSSSSSSIASGDHTHGLLRGKVGANGLLTASALQEYQACHRIVYVERNPRISDKTIAMAAAYKAWQNWKQDHRSGVHATPSSNLTTTEPELLKKLQSMAIAEAALSFDECDKLSNDKDKALALAQQFVIPLYEQILPAN